jgi:hypothetical protein
MKRRERFMAATGWNVDPRVDRSGQCFPRLHAHTSGLHGRKEPCSTSRNGQERCVSQRGVPNRFAAKLVYESTNFNSVS